MTIKYWCCLLHLILIQWALCQPCFSSQKLQWYSWFPSFLFFFFLSELVSNHHSTPCPQYTTKFQIYSNLSHNKFIVTTLHCTHFHKYGFIILPHLLAMTLCKVNLHASPYYHLLIAVYFLSLSFVYSTYGCDSWHHNI